MDLFAGEIEAASADKTAAAPPILSQLQNLLIFITIRIWIFFTSFGLQRCKGVNNFLTIGLSYLLNRTFLSDELSDDQKSLIWDNRYLCYQIPDSLPLVLSCCPKWSTETLGEVSGLILYMF